MTFKSLLFSTTLVFSVTAHASPYSEAITSQVFLQGGTSSTSEWGTPISGKAQVFVSIPKGSSAATAMYNIYPKGNTTHNDDCSSTDTVSPCFEAMVDQKSNQGKFVQLVSDNTKVWDFNNNGFVSVVASKSSSDEVVGAAGAQFVQSPRTQSFTKVSNEGQTILDGAILGVGATDWACTQDNNTRLVWEIKTSDKGLRDKDNQYSWYDTNTAINGGYAGLQDGGKGLCTGGIACDTAAYVEAVNAQKLCGFNDWRVPSFHELATLIKPDVFPSINATYFPENSDYRVWTGTTDPSYSSNAWYVYFGNGTASLYKGSAFSMRVRLVRGGM